MRDWLSWYFQPERRWRSLRRGTRGRWRRRCLWAGRWARWACWPPWRPSPSRTSNGRRRRRRRRCRGVGTLGCAMLDSLLVQVVGKGVWALWAATRGSIGQVSRVSVFGESKQCEKRRHPDVKGYQIHSFDRWDQQLWFRWSLVKQSLNNWNGQESAVISYSDISGFAPLLPYLISFSYLYRWSCWNCCCSRDSGHKVDGAFVNIEVFRILPKVFGQICACCVANPFFPIHSFLKKRDIWRIQEIQNDF